MTELNRQTLSVFPKTKYSIPENNTQRIVRFRLSNMLDRGLKGQFLLVCAPAGYGKTTAVMDFIKSLHHKVMWFSVGLEDNQAKQFWKNLFFSFSELIPEIFELTEDIFLLPDDEMIRELVIILTNKVGELNREIVLVLDDFHLIKNPVVSKGVEFFVKSLPNNAKVIFISREGLPFNVEKLRVSRKYSEVTFEELKFSKNDLLDLVTASHANIHVTELEEILLQNEGWITGIQIMLMENLQGKKNIRHFLIEEILTDMTENLKDFFYGTSIFDVFCTDLCNAIFERNDSFELIRNLQRKNAFIFTLDEDGKWYRYHHLFLDTLRNQQQNRPTEFFRTLHFKAAKWYEDNRMFENAIDHYLRAEAVQQSVALIEKVAPVAISTNDFNRIMSWMRILPENIINSNYVLCLIYTWYYQLDSQFDKTFEKAWSYIEKAERAYHDFEYRCNDAIRLEAAKADILHFKVVYGMLSNDFAVFMKSSAEIAKMNTSNTIFAKNGLEFNRTQPTLIFLLFENLDFFFNDAFFQTIRRLKEQKIKDLSYGYVLYGEMFYEFNKLEEALPLLIDGSLSALDEKKYGAYLPGVNATAKIHWAKGDAQKAMEVLLLGEKTLLEHNKVFLAKKMKVFRMWFSIMKGELDIVQGWMNEDIFLLSIRITIQNEFDLSVYARGLIENKNYQQAEVLLYRLLEFADCLKQIRWTIVYNNILARLYFNKKDYVKALDYLQLAIQLGMQHKYFRIFVEEGRLMDHLLGHYLKCRRLDIDEDTISFIQQIRACIKDESGESSLYELNLTETELKVLHLIGEGFSNVEIANRQSVQIDTVKKHISSIYRKLQVKNRTQALRKAEEFGIFYK